MKNLVLLALFLCGTTFFAQEINFDKLDKYLENLEKNDKFTTSIAVSKNGEIIYQNSIGFADVENQIRADHRTIYKIGSISKTFTATLVMKTVEEGKLSLNQALADFFPDVENAEKITLKNLLNHQSGIFNLTSDPTFFDWHTNAHTQAEVLDIIKRNGTVFEPGSKTEYSNSNYMLLTFILEKVYNQTFDELLQSKITQPLGLKNTYIGYEINPENHEAHSYQFIGKWVKEPETHPSVTLGAGAIVSNAEDLVKFSDALFAGKIISDESLQQMLTIENDFGLGIISFPFYDKKCLGHTGGIDGFSSVFSHIREDNLSYAVLSNGTNFNNNDVYIAILSAIYGKDFDIPEFALGYQPTEENLQKYIGVYSSPLIPMKITITTKNGVLIAQATGQPSFPLEAVEEHNFKFDQAFLKMTFSPDEETMTLYQGGVILFKKEQ